MKKQIWMDEAELDLAVRLCDHSLAVMSARSGDDRKMPVDRLAYGFTQSMVRRLRDKFQPPTVQP